MWLVAGVAVVVGAVAVIVAAIAETGPAPVTSRRGPITPDELRRPDIPFVWRGYDPGHVDALLARAARAIEDAELHGTRRATRGQVPDFIAATFEHEADDTLAHEPPADEPPERSEADDA